MAGRIDERGYAILDDSITTSNQSGNQFTPTPYSDSRRNNSKTFIIILAIIALVGFFAYFIFQNSDSQSGNPNKSHGTTTQYSSQQTQFETVVVPVCVNKSVNTVLTELAEQGLVAHLEYAFSDSVQQGYVISQSIANNTYVQKGETVILTISKGTDVCPEEYSQKLVVTAVSGSSKGTAALYEWSNGTWERQCTYSCAVGKNGIGPAKEGSKTTPQGIHHLGVVLSSYTVDTNLQVYKATSSTGVVDDENSSLYNRILEKKDVPSGVSFDNIGEGLTNGKTYAMIYIEHNGTGLSSDNVVKGKGSAIGIRGRTGSLSPTYGDVDISIEDMKDLLKRFDVNKNPMIEIRAD